MHRRGFPSTLWPRAIGAMRGQPLKLPGVFHTRKKRDVAKNRGRLARLTGLEPATPGVTGRYSNQLSYNRSLPVRVAPNVRT